MFALIAATAIADPGGLTLADAYRFGVSREIIAANIRCLDRHDREVVNKFECGWAQWAWSQRQGVVRKAWDNLDTALDETKSDHERLRALRVLFDTIGEANYYAGKLFPPVPDYGR